jgi:hypothetical protein
MATGTLINNSSIRSEHPLLAYLSLFTSLGTLVCCALPSLLVLFGLGATVASFLSAAPWLVTLAQHRIWVFTVSGALIAGDFLYIYWLSPRLKVQGQACSVADGPTACATATRISRVALWVAIGIYAIGFFTAYLLGPILIRLGP